jgi:conjugal transfer pilus assembly protein TraU
MPMPGIPAGFWEPVRLVDVVREPYSMVNMGGIKMGGGFKKQGTNAVKANSGRGGQKSSFYHVHWYVYPLIHWLEVLIDFACIEKGSFDLAYVTELDPMWGNDELSFILNPEAAIFGNPVAQAACSADCIKASTHFPANELFWCAGCQGSIYPFTGSGPAHTGGVQASQLLTQRMIAKLHRELLLWQTSGREALCSKKPAPIIKKTQYKIQMTYPIPTATGAHACNPIGRTEVMQGSGKEFPYSGEDFGYLLWRKRNCCLF